MDSGLVWDMAPLYKWILPNWYTSYSAGCLAVLSAIALALWLIRDSDVTDNRKRRLAAIYILLSIHADGRNHITRWGATSCFVWMGIKHAVAASAIRTLEQMHFDDGEKILEPVENIGQITKRRVSANCPVIVPHSFRARADDSISPFERIFQADEHSQLKFLSLITIILIYADFDEKELICRQFMFFKIVNDDEYDDELKLSIAPTNITTCDRLRISFFPSEDDQRINANYRVFSLLASTGLISTVRAVINGNQVAYIASYGSSYLRERHGDFQQAIRKYVDVNHEFQEQNGFPVWYVGDMLCESITPQYYPITDTVNSTLNRFQSEEDIALEDMLGDDIFL
jgi:hypothetical protein